MDTLSPPSSLFRLFLQYQSKLSAWQVSSNGLGATIRLCAPSGCCGDQVVGYITPVSSHDDLAIRLMRGV